MAAFAYRTKESAFSDNSDDSDDSSKDYRHWKRATKAEDEASEKVPLVDAPVEPPPQEQINSTTKRKKNTIWCEVLNEQIMSETLNKCGIKQLPKGYGERGEESYDYRLGKRKRNEIDCDDEEMSGDSEHSESAKRTKRFKDNLHAELTSEDIEAAKKIIRVLNEQKRYLIYRVVRFLGAEKAVKFLKMTEDIEENGGLMIKNNERRRTPGGVYFYLIKNDTELDKKAVLKIFEGEFNSYERKQKINEFRRQKKQKSNRNKSRKQRKWMKTQMDFESLVNDESELSFAAAKSESSSPIMESPISNSTAETSNSDIKKDLSVELSASNPEAEDMEEDNTVCSNTVIHSDLEEGEIE